ncbi:MAG: DUF2069 domain-containing protein [Gammaproteobacteria bacterium]|nr:DUF2069 domain-containing protein [Gammaproteobacteria bacterium]
MRTGKTLHPLKIICLLSWISLLAFQLSLFLPGVAVSYYWAGLLVFALLLPGRGLFVTRRYTYKWIGFLTMFYFCVGISELVSNPALRIYGFGTTITSTLLFLSSIYFARYLGLQARNS